MNDPNAHPEISGSAENMGQYETVFPGYPIWWCMATRTVCTFVEDYDRQGKAQKKIDKWMKDFKA